MQLFLNVYLIKSLLISLILADRNDENGQSHPSE